MIIRKLAHRAAGIVIIPCPAEQAGVLDQFDTLRKEAKREIRIANPSITVEDILRRAIRECKERGVRIRILTRRFEGGFGTSENTLRDLSNLLRGIGEIRIRQSLHATFFIFDDRCVYITSANLVKGAFYNDEIGVVVRTEDAVKDAIEYFEELWKNAEEYGV
ncbi:MAG: phospholipase D family protein [Desulfurococcales archaeon]|nr:phospholipase D family protein [Desulfurococcales archaeon]